MNTTIGNYVVFGTGFAVTLADFMKFGTITMGFLGGICMAMSMIYQMQSKKIRKEIDLIEYKEAKKKELS